MSESRGASLLSPKRGPNPFATATERADGKRDMSILDLPKTNLSRAIALAVATMSLLTMSLMPPQASAAAQDYRFELAGPPVKSGKSTLVKVRLLHVPDGKPVSGAIIFKTKFDMGPEGMASMTAPAKGAPSLDPGVYDVQTEPSMAGRWALTLAAKVQGEPDTVQGTITVPVPK
jgi:hypothetical protein